MQLSYQSVKKYLMESYAKHNTGVSEQDAAALITHWMQALKKNEKSYKEMNLLFQRAIKSYIAEMPAKADKAAEPLCLYDQEILPDFGIYWKDIPFPPPENPKFTFIDLFAGIGGFRLALQALGGRCVFSSEWDREAQKTYELNFGEVPYGDITLKKTKDAIPEKFDILCAGFPCQAFSIAGHREGFNDKKGRGNLFFDIAEILEKHRPEVLFLENVKNLKTHDKGNTFRIIYNKLCSLGYHVHALVMNSSEYGNLPQNRERIYIVGFKAKVKFSFPEKIPLTRTIHDCLDLQEALPKYYYNSKPLFAELEKEVVKKDTVYQWRRKYVRENKSGVCPTLTANMGMGGHNVPIIRDNFGIRKLTPKECINFQGYPKEYILPQNTAESHLHKQAGNSVSVPVLQRIAEKIVQALNE